MKKRLLRQLCRILNLSNDFIRRYKKIFKALLDDSDSSGSDSSGSNNSGDNKRFRAIIGFVTDSCEIDVGDINNNYEVGLTRLPSGHFNYFYFGIDAYGNISKHDIWHIQEDGIIVLIKTRSTSYIVYGWFIYNKQYGPILNLKNAFYINDEDNIIFYKDNPVDITVRVYVYPGQLYIKI